MRPQSCTVGGPLALVLHIMRVLSLAPLTIARERAGYRIRVSKRYAYVGYFCIILLNVLHVLCMWIDTNVHSKYYTVKTAQIPLFIIVVLLNASVVALFTLYGSLFSVSRMNKLIEQVFYMEKVIPAKKSNEDTNKSKKLIVFLFMIFPRVLIDVANYIYYVYIMRYSDIIIYGFVLTRIKFTIVRLIQVYVFIIYEEMLSKIRIVREEIQDLADLLEFEFVPTSAFTQSADVSLRKIGEKLDFVSEMFKKMNQCNEHTAFFVYICIVSWIIQTAFGLVSIEPGYVSASSSLDVLVVMHISFTLVVLIEPFRGIELEMQAMKLQVGRIATTDYVTDSIPAPLEMLYDELSNMDMTFSPLGVFSMNRSLLAKTLGAVVTYLVIIVQFKVT